ncbi:MAG: hypothetical protein FJX57_13035, partial [Alphaproteobacteria bacterium]|nr:hypothetical protein [Alphaproteobacteria bacterium]
MTLELFTARTRVQERLRGYALLLAAIATGLLTALALSLHLLWAREQQARAEFARGIAAAALGLLDRGNDRIARSLQGFASELAPGDPARLVHGGPVRDGLDRIRHLGPLLVSIGLAD